MNKTFPYLFAGLLAFCLPATQVAAQQSLPGESGKARFDSLSPEQKKGMRKKLKERYNSLPPAEQEKIREGILNRIDSLPADQKKRLRQPFRNRNKDKV